MHRKLRALLGLAAIGVLVVAVVATWFVLKGGLRSGLPVSAVFGAPGVGQQLPVGGDVKVRGVLVGQISELRLQEDGKAVVEMLLKDGFELPADSRAEIRSKTLFGQKWVELIPTDGGSPTFVAGDVIPDSRTTEPLELERALQLGHDLISELPLQDLSTVFAELADGFGGSEDDARTAIDRGLVALKAVNEKGPAFDLALRQLREFSEWLDSNDTDLLSFMSSLDEANRALVGASPEFKASLDSVPVFLDDFASFQIRNEKHLGRLIQSGASLAELLQDHTGDIRGFIKGLESFTTVWNSGLSQPCGGLYEQNMTCWQVYGMPGIESRGLYGDGEDPLSDQPTDPLFDPRNTPTSVLERFVAAYGSGASSDDLAEILLAPTATPTIGVAP